MKKLTTQRNWHIRLNINQSFVLKKQIWFIWNKFYICEISLKRIAMISKNILIFWMVHTVQKVTVLSSLWKVNSSAKFTPLRFCIVVVYNCYIILIIPMIMLLVISKVLLLIFRGSYWCLMELEISELDTLVLWYRDTLVLWYRDTWWEHSTAPEDYIISNKKICKLLCDTYAATARPCWCYYLGVNNDNLLMDSEIFEIFQNSGRQNQETHYFDC